MKREWTWGARHVALLLLACWLPSSARAEAQHPFSSLVDQVKNSGPVLQEVKPLVDSTAAKAFTSTFGPSNADVDYSTGVRCFKDGCLVEVTYRDRCVEQAETDLFRHAPAPLRRWPGAVYHTPVLTLPERRVRATWALLLPDLSVEENRRRFQGFADMKMSDTPIRRDVCASVPAGTLRQPTTSGGEVK